jgi:hypothetical protein
MNPDYEKRLEARIDRELKELGEWQAPATLASRVMRAVERRAALPWYRRSWQTWPVGLQWASLAALLAMAGGLCFGAWNLAHSTAGTTGAREVAQGFAGLGVFWRTLNVLGGAAVLSVRHLGTGFIVGSVAVLLMAYAACVSLGTVYVRLAMARR